MGPTHAPEPDPAATGGAHPTLYRDDLEWYEHAHWFLLTASCCAAASLTLGVGMLSVARGAEMPWIIFLYDLGGLAFGGSLGPRYLAVTQALWAAHRRPYRPLWWLPEGRMLVLELFGGWLLAGLAAWRLGREVGLLHAVSADGPQAAWVIGWCLAVQFCLSSGVTLTWPIYRWLRDLPSKPLRNRS